MESVKIIECPRDAMQGVKAFIPTEEKVQYLQMLLNCGFDTLDIGSFVSPKAIPQMQDTAAVLKAINLKGINTKLLTIVANKRGLEAAVQFPEIDFIGFPFSISENFQMRNTHKTIAQSIGVLKEILNISAKANKKVVVYLSMGFGNPYGEPWSAAIVCEWVDRLVEMGVQIISLSDTVGSSTPKTIKELFSILIPRYPNIEFGAHLHTTKNTWFEKLDAAYQAGCYRFDGAIQGYGGCPMAGDALVGNMPTEQMLSYFTTRKVEHSIKPMPFESAHNRATIVFSKYH